MNREWQPPRGQLYLTLAMMILFLLSLISKGMRVASFNPDIFGMGAAICGLIQMIYLPRILRNCKLARKQVAPRPINEAERKAVARVLLIMLATVIAVCATSFFLVPYLGLVLRPIERVEIGMFVWTLGAFVLALTPRLRQVA